MDLFAWYFLLLGCVVLINAQITQDVTGVSNTTTSPDTMDADNVEKSRLGRRRKSGMRRGIRMLQNDTTSNSSKLPHLYTGKNIYKGNSNTFFFLDFQGLTPTPDPDDTTSNPTLLPTSINPVTPTTSTIPVINVTVCENATVADVVFLADSSGSISLANLQQIRFFLLTVVSGLDIGPNNVRVGLAQFTGAPFQEFLLNEHQDRDSLLAALNNYPVRRGGTMIGRALDFIRTQFFTESAGSRANQGVPQIAVVLTDGASFDDVVEPARRLRQQGVDLFSIGVGLTQVTELEAIANQPSDQFVFSIENFGVLQTLSEVLLRSVCKVIIDHGQVYAHIKARVNFTLGTNVTEVLQQFVLSLTSTFCVGCQVDFNATVTPVQTATP
ncbi:collagen alpha-4(VI) chain-like isoform X2 [Syngnathus typhle]|uniref:collagen alpha-4(VI) chain-like isoform X2 n=1 Tax=Syngnathus typhle TaxID=161592 RepID=UPI002A6B207A|nr:collagen alpha-4(VI) chain-like isoform X2 [Syngnathus typhle]